jgi:cyclic pyranopterin monophosphate synthase
MPPMAGQMPRVLVVAATTSRRLVVRQQHCHNETTGRFLSTTTTTTTSNHDDKDDNNSKVSSTSKEQHQHALFQEQLLELEAERQSLFSEGGKNVASTQKLQGTLSSTFRYGSDESTKQKDLTRGLFIEQMKEWRDEQVQVFGKELNDGNDDTAPSQQQQQQQQPPTSDCQDQQEEDWEDQKEERQLLFQFSAHEKAAWQQLPSPILMQDILQQVAIARKQSDETERPKEENSTNNNKANSDDDDDIVNTTTSTEPEDLPSVSSPDRSNLLLYDSPLPLHHDAFSHVSVDGTSVHMVDVGHKAITQRMAHARAQVELPPSVVKAFLQPPPPPQNNNNEIGVNDVQELVGPKGPIFATAKIAGIMAAKQTSSLIPLCHPLPLDQVTIDISFGKKNENQNNLVTIDCICRVTHKTGVEMEALVGASVAALTIYDMVKAVSHDVIIRNTRLMAKSGGKRDVMVKERKFDDENGNNNEKANHGSTTVTATNNNTVPPLLMYLHVGPNGDVWTGTAMFAAKHLPPDYVKSVELDEELQQHGDLVVEVLEDHSDWAQEIYNTSMITPAMREKILKKQRLN